MRGGKNNGEVVHLVPEDVGTSGRIKFVRKH